MRMDGRKDGQTDVTKLKFAFPNFAPKNRHRAGPRSITCNTISERAGQRELAIRVFETPRITLHIVM